MVGNETTVKTRLRYTADTTRPKIQGETLGGMVDVTSGASVTERCVRTGQARL